MMQEQKNDMRLVSKSEYVRRQADRAVNGVLGVAVGLLAILCFLITICCIVVIIITFCYVCSGFDVIYLPLLLFEALMLLIFGGGTYMSYKGAMILFQASADCDPGIPLTRANTAHLPAHDSLVRASEEPLQIQEAVLLRAASETGERHEEHLLRASTGEHE